MAALVCIKILHLQQQWQQITQTYYHDYKQYGVGIYDKDLMLQELLQCQLSPPFKNGSDESSQNITSYLKMTGEGLKYFFGNENMTDILTFNFHNMCIFDNME